VPVMDRQLGAFEELACAARERQFADAQHRSPA
jgi:hypothetical protein